MCLDVLSIIHAFIFRVNFDYEINIERIIMVNGKVLVLTRIPFRYSVLGNTVKAS